MPIKYLRPRVARLLRLKVYLIERFKPGELQATLLWAGLVGFLGALSTVAFREGIRLVQLLFYHHSGSLVEAAEELVWWERLFMPIVGGLCAGLILQFGMHLARKQSSTDYMEAIALGDGKISARTTLIKSASSLFTVASGGSIGREGSMVQLSAMLASAVGRLASLPAPRLRLVVACGSAAGITAAYNAPIAGSLFVAEIVLGTIAMESFGPLLVSSVVANATVHQFLGYKSLYEIPPLHLATNREFIFFIGLGVTAGSLAPMYLELLDKSKAFFAKLNLPLFVKLMGGGTVVGIISAYYPQVWGNGYSVVNSILHTDWLWYILLTVLILKLIATAATSGSGAVGGVFTPTIFMGAALGALYGHGVHAAWPNISSTPDVYTVVGMGSFLAATTYAPLTSILMIFEMTMDYQIILPLTLACVTAYFTARFYSEDSLYSESLRKKRSEKPVPSFASMHISDVLRKNPPCVNTRATFSEITKLFVEQHVNHLYVTDDKMRFHGVIPLHEIKPYLNNESLARAIVAADIAKTDFPVLTPEMKLSQALDIFAKHAGERIPVLDDLRSRKLIGVASKTDLLLSFQEGYLTAS